MKKNINKDLMQAKEAFQTELFKFKTEKLKRMQKWEGAEVDRRRRSATIETGGESKELDAMARLQGIANVRDIDRNYSLARSILLQLKNNIVGTEGKIQVNTPNGKQASDYFNKVWAKECSARDDSTWSEILKQVIHARYTSGDCIILVDTDFADGDGKIYIWESDQICNINDNDFKTFAGDKGWTQEQGIVRNKLGKEIGYFVTNKRGAQSVKLEEATYLERNKDCRLICSPNRPNQGRGIADFLTAINDLKDNKSFVQSMLQTAKLSAQLMGKVKRKTEDTYVPNPLSNTETDTVDLETPIESQAETGTYNYERYEEACGGIVEYMEGDDDFELLQNDRPSPNAMDFNKLVGVAAGAGLGMAKSYVNLSADSSYTSFRGDMVLTWTGCFYVEQKWLERRVCDWVAKKVLTHAESLGLITLDEGWEESLSWTWPIMPSVDELKEVMALEKALKIGKITYSDMLGPQWREKFAQSKVEVTEIRKDELPYSIVETGNGTIPEQINKEVTPNPETDTMEAIVKDDDSEDDTEDSMSVLK